MNLELDTTEHGPKNLDYKLRCTMEQCILPRGLAFL